MVLQIVDGNHASGLLDVLSVLVGCTGALVLLVDVSNFQNVLQSIKSDLDNLVVHGVEQITHGLDAALLDQVSNLRRFLQASGSSVRDRPAGFLLGLEIGILENVDERRNDVGINDGLDLHSRTGSDVGNGPASFLSNTVFWR